ncbi:hypothetical protein [Sneathiella glossodoripedis]|uniref:hypothetical protein n=1 Tax=Sneathiella glossodoripedis TaxID=418853 RepID=UPI0011DD4D92
MIELLQDRSDVMLKGQVINFVRPIKFTDGELLFSPAPGTPADLGAKLGRRLREITGKPWQVSMSSDVEGGPTIAEMRMSRKAAMIAAAENHPVVQKIKEVFAGASVREVRDLSPDIENMIPEDISEGDDIE